MPMQSFVVPLAPVSAGYVANVVKGYALAVGVAFSIWFAWQWWRKREAEVALERKARAKSVWRCHLASALQHPELADAAADQFSTATEATRYRTFVCSLLAAADEILAVEPTDRWRDTLARALQRHSTYLRSAEFREEGLRDCSEEVRALVQRVTQG